MEIAGFMHIYMVNNWLDIVKSQISKMKKSGLWDKMDKLYIGYIDPNDIYCEEDPIVFKDDKIKILYTSKDPKIYESLTLVNLQYIAGSLGGCVFYVHLKGISRMNNPFQNDWRELMEYFIIERHELCLRELETNDIVGTNWHLGEGYMGAKVRHSRGTPITPHFSGNFWWANVSYLKKLPNLIPIHSRFDCEFWIGKGSPKVAEVWNSGKYHHFMLYPARCYKNKPERIRHLNG